MDDFVRKMHTQVGPAAGDRGVDARRSPTPAPRRSSTSRSTCPTPAPRRCAATRSASTAASSTAYLPELDKYLHYRSIDVSSLKELCRRWYPAVYKKRPGQGRRRTGRSLDISESIAELALLPRRTLPRAAADAGRRDAQSSAQPQSSSRSAPSSVTTERSRAEWPMSPMRHALPANSPEPAADLDAVVGEQRLAQRRRRRRPRAATRW